MTKGDRNNGKWIGASVAIIGVISSLVTIFTFTSGIPSLGEVVAFLAPGKNEKPIKDIEPSILSSVEQSIENEHIVSESAYVEFHPEAMMEDYRANVEATEYNYLGKRLGFPGRFSRGELVYSDIDARCRNAYIISPSQRYDSAVCIRLLSERMRSVEVYCIFKTQNLEEQKALNGELFKELSRIKAISGKLVFIKSILSESSSVADGFSIEPERYSRDYSTVLLADCQAEI